MQWKRISLWQKQHGQIHGVYNGIQIGIKIVLQMLRNLKLTQPEQIRIKQFSRFF